MNVCRQSSAGADLSSSSASLQQALEMENIYPLCVLCFCPLRCWELVLLSPGTRLLIGTIRLAGASCSSLDRCQVVLIQEEAQEGDGDGRVWDGAAT